MKKISALLCVLFLASASVTHALDIKTIVDKAEMSQDGLSIAWKLVDLDKSPGDDGYILFVRITTYDRAKDQTDEELLAVVNKAEKALQQKEKRKLLPRVDVKASIQLTDN